MGIRSFHISYGNDINLWFVISSYGSKYGKPFQTLFAPVVSVWEINFRSVKYVNPINHKKNKAWTRMQISNDSRESYKSKYEKKYPMRRYIRSNTIWNSFSICTICKSRWNNYDHINCLIPLSQCYWSHKLFMMQLVEYIYGKNVLQNICSMYYKGIFLMKNKDSRVARFTFPSTRLGVETPY